MSFRIPGLCALLLFTAGCSSLPSLQSLTGIDQDTPVLPEAVQAAPDLATPPPDDWCRRMAADARAQAAADGFDAATQERTSLQSFQQCAALQRG